MIAVENGVCLIALGVKEQIWGAAPLALSWVCLAEPGTGVNKDLTQSDSLIIAYNE